MLVLEQRNTEYHAGCSNTSVTATRGSFKEMVGERESNNLQTVRDQLQSDFGQGAIQSRASWEDCTTPVKTWLEGPWDLQEPKRNRVVTAVILGTCLCRVRALRIMRSTNSGSVPLS